MTKEFGIPQGENLVFMECYPEKFFYQKRLLPLSTSDGQPHIVFIGMDVRDILPQIEEVASRKIHVHICDMNQAGWNTNSLESFDSKNAFGNSEFIHPFNRFTYLEIANGSFATFLTQFDACLVTYDFWSASGLSRYNNSIPSRFSIAILAGIPIIIPKGYLNGCKEILEKYQIGFEYENYTDLRNKLSNKNMLTYFRGNATKNSKMLSLENNFKKMDKFLKSIVD